MNTVLVQIRDGGGGWDMYFRFSENGTPVTDLQLSPVSGRFEDYQIDSDEDGIGDDAIFSSNVGRSLPWLLVSTSIGYRSTSFG